MPNKYNIVVVIPVHKSDPTPYELISFEQCFKILNRYSIKLIAPVDLDLASYRRIAPDLKHIYIDPKWQKSVSMYNKLKVSRFFYNLFKEFDFILTYELDAFVFSDQLDLWCQKNYDYIGAPWFEGFTEPSDKLIGVGNSGFSLRKVSTFRGILKNFYYSLRLDHPSLINSIKEIYRYPLSKIKSLGGENHSIQKYNNWYEDYFISTRLKENFPDLNVAPVDDAVKFSFETNPLLLYQMNGRNLPFGCHAWWRYDFAFWKPFIEDFGYSLSVNDNK